MGNKEWLCSVGRTQIVEMVMGRITLLTLQYLAAVQEVLLSRDIDWHINSKGLF